MSKHTPGPWVAVSRTNAHIDIEAPKQHGYVARHVASTGHGNHEANARLITAAPELLEALRELLSETEDGIATCPLTRIRARAAIEKAEGRPCA
jgi:hypothetical protein